VEVSKTGWNDIGGLDSIKQVSSAGVRNSHGKRFAFKLTRSSAAYVHQKLMETVEWPIRFKATFQRFGIEPSRGILLVGPPGGGKTTIAKVSAHGPDVSFSLLLRS
jgi:SpoVK/Ycf46/Vps4 family AAA+-type ATPase